MLSEFLGATVQHKLPEQRIQFIFLYVDRINIFHPDFFSPELRNSIVHSCVSPMWFSGAGNTLSIALRACGRIWQFRCTAYPGFAAATGSAPSLPVFPIHSATQPLCLIQRNLPPLHSQPQPYPANPL